MSQVYIKNFKKSFITGILPPVIVISFITSIALSWSSLQDIIMERLEQMGNPVYQAILGDLGLEGLGLTWQAAIFMYAGGTMNILLVLLSLYPARSLYQEIDKKSFDIIFSYPVSRWKYLFDKFAVYMTFGALFPLSMLVTVIGSSIFIGEDINSNLVLHYSIGVYVQLFALGALALLCVAIFLESNKALVASGSLIVGQYFLESLGGLIPNLSNVQFLSIFHYFKISSILEQGILPLDELVIVLTIGILACLTALGIFEKREYAL